MSNDLLFVAQNILALSEIFVFRLVCRVITVQVLLCLLANYGFPVLDHYPGRCNIFFERFHIWRCYRGERRIKIYIG